MNNVTILCATILLLGLILQSSAQCPVNNNGCTCYEEPTKGTVINCRSRGLTEIPTFQPTSDSFYLLTLANNDITSIGSQAFFTTAGQPLNVERIDLEGNQIFMVDENAFTGVTSVTELLMDMTGTDFPKAVKDLPQLEVLLIKGVHSPRLPAQVLQPLTALRSFSLVSCNLEALTSDDLTGQRNSLEELHLNDNDLDALPTEALGILGKVHTLDISANSINALPADGFSGMSSLRDLDLSRNILQTVHSNAFRGVEDTLETLILHNCRFYDVNLPPLERLRNLRQLDLNNNEDIRSLPNGLFLDMDSLEELGLRTCDLTTLNQNTFKGLGDTLRTLDLASNGITSIADYTFQAFTSLETLNLNIQDLHSTLTPQTFRGLENGLKLLNLEGTSMTTDKLPAVSYLRTLETLKLSSNGITSLPDFVFMELTRLKVLEFNTNRLSSVQPAAMYGLQDSLETINLRTNDIPRMSHCVYKDFSALETIYLSNNPLQCDCHARWLREWLDKYDAFTQKQFKWKCAGPDNHKDRYIYDLNADDMVCVDGEEVEVCEQFTTPTLPPPIEGSSTAKMDPEELVVNASDITETSVTLIWEVTGGIVSSFLVEAVDVSADPDEPPIYQEGAGEHERNVTVDSLRSATLYTLCVTAYYQHPDIPRMVECVNSTTDGSTLPITKKPSQLAIILGSVIGVLVFVVLLVVIILVVRRSTAATHAYDKNNGDLPESRAGLPTMGYNSKRFSKPRSTMTSMGGSQQDLEKKLDGFTQEERNRILQLLSSSTLSVASAGSTRYLDEPRPHRWTGGASAYYNEEDPYHEIAQGDQYEYIPADQVTKYDYIPADQVQRIEPNPLPVVTPPPLPPPHPESGQPSQFVFADVLSQPVPHESHVVITPPPSQDSSEWI